jgi:arginase family enzyme
VSVAALLCRTSDRTPGASRGARELALALDPDARVVGTPDYRIANWRDDLRDSHDCILKAGELVDEALADGRFPVLTSSDCSICMATFAAVAKHYPDVHVVWFDAHADSNTPDTTPSGFLGGMCLGASVGLWDAGFPAALDPSRVHGVGIRDVDPGEWAPEPGRPSGPVFVHLDLDCLDPSVLPAQFPVPGGLSLDDLRDALASLENVVGIEITAFEEPDGLVEEIAAIVREVL